MEHDNPDFIDIDDFSNACFSGDIDFVRNNIHKLEDLNELNRLKETALMAALQGGHPEIARFLLEQGIDIDRQNSFGRTALHVAVEMDTTGHDRKNAPSPPTSLTELVLSFRPQIGIQDNDGKTALDLAAYWENMIDLLQRGT